MTGDHWSVAWSGIPYVDKGRGPAGYDCWGLVQAVFQQRYGIELPSYEDEYAHSVSGEQIEEVIKRECEKWNVVYVCTDSGRVISDAVEGDVVVLRILNRAMHCGVMLNRFEFMHILVGSHCTVEDIRDRTWVRRIEDIYRHDRHAG